MTTASEANSRSVLYVCSPGGHAVELGELISAESPQVRGLLVCDGRPQRVLGVDCQVDDCNRDTPWRVVLSVLQMAAALYRMKPAIIVSTGAAPGAIAILLGRLLGCRGVWVDSLASADRISMSGRLCKPFCEKFFVQWPHLAGNGAEFHGTIL